MVRHNFFMLFIMISVPLFAYNEQGAIIIPNGSEYKKLAIKFGPLNLKNVLYNYQNSQYNSDGCFLKWNQVANEVIGYEYVEEQRRYFLVNIMLHVQENKVGLDVLYNAYLNKKVFSNNLPTPQGPVSVQLFSAQYNTAMQVCNDIRSKLFTGENINPLVLVRESSAKVAPEVKWSLFKGVAVISYLISSCLKKKKKKNEEERDDVHSSIFSFLVLSDALEKVEKDARNALEEAYPILKTHHVKSLVDDKLSWFSDRNNWILCGSACCMALLLLCLFRNKIPYSMYHYVHRPFTFVVVKHI